jgi:hypothetical protein
VYLLAGAGEYLLDRLGRELLGKCRHGEGHERRRADSEEVAEGVRGRNGAVVGCLVDDRGEEVDGEGERTLLVEAIDRRVIRGIEPDEQVARSGRRESG